MTFTNANGDLTTSDFDEPIAANASAKDFKNALSSVYSNQAGSTITVTLVMYDENGAETGDNSLAVDYEYTISLDKRIDGQTFTAITAQGIESGNKPTFEIKTPDLEQVSGSPISGSYTVSCTINGNLYKTDAIAFDSWQATV